MNLKIESVVEKFIELREKRAVLKRAYEAEDFLLKQAMEKIEIHLMKRLEKEGVESFKTAVGTAYISTETKTSCADWSSFGSWVVVNSRPDMFEKRLLTKAILEYEEQEGQLPPYVNKMVERVVRVRKS